MAKEYIEREATKRMFEDDYNFNAAVAIDMVPTADVVEVVRCIDCEYSSFVKSCSKYECRKGCGALKYCNDFCSYGKRKTN